MNDIVFYGGGVCIVLVGFWIGYHMGRAAVLEEWKDHEINGNNGWQEEALYWRYKLFGKPDD